MKKLPSCKLLPIINDVCLNCPRKTSVWGLSARKCRVSVVGGKAVPMAFRTMSHWCRVRSSAATSRKQLTTVLMFGTPPLLLLLLSSSSDVEEEEEEEEAGYMHFMFEAKLNVC